MSENNKMEQEISELYRLFKKYKLAPNFSERCSPYGERREVAQYLEEQSLHYIEREMIDYYCFKAIYTMGDEQDFKYFLPRLIEVMVTDYSHGNYLFKKLKMSGFEHWKTLEKNIVYKICEQHFIVKLENGSCDGTLSTILEDYVYLFDLNNFYDIWFKSEEKNALDHFLMEAPYQCITKDFYWKYLEKIVNMYLETTDSNLKKKLDEFLDQHEKYLKYLY